MNVGYRFLRWLVRIERLPYKHTVLRRYFGPKIIVDDAFEVDFFGLRWPGTLANEIDWHVFFFGTYAPEELQLIGDLLVHQRQYDDSSRPVCVDLGANVGNHALYMASCGADVHAFEPYALVADRLQEKLDLNRIRNVKLHRVALGDEQGKREFFEPKTHNLGMGTMVKPDGDAKATDVPIERGDDYFPRMNIDRIDVLKVDIEGHEFQALSGLRKTLDRCRPFILMELQDETRRLVGNVEGLKKLLYPDARVMELAHDRAGNYMLRNLRFEKARELFVLPKESSFELN
jgi:FkbM family methyltransferase